MDQRPQLKPQTPKLTEKRMWRTLQDIHIAEDFLNRTPTAQNMSASIDKWDLMKLKWVCVGKEIVKRKGFLQSGRKCLPAVYPTQKEYLD